MVVRAKQLAEVVQKQQQQLRIKINYDRAIQNREAFVQANTNTTLRTNIREI